MVRAIAEMRSGGKFTDISDLTTFDLHPIQHSRHRGRGRAAVVFE